MIRGPIKPPHCTEKREGVVKKAEDHCTTDESIPPVDRGGGRGEALEEGKSM